MRDRYQAESDSAIAPAEVPPEESEQTQDQSVPESSQSNSSPSEAPSTEEIQPSTANAAQATPIAPATKTPANPQQASPAQVNQDDLLLELLGGGTKQVNQGKHNPKAATQVASVNQDDLLSELLGPGVGTAENTGSTVDQNELLGELLGDAAASVQEYQTDSELLADILETSGHVDKKAGKKSSSVLHTVIFELVVPNWNMTRLSRSFFSTFKKIEEANQRADQWVDHVQSMLERLVTNLPDTWPKRDSTEITSKLLGQFYAITQQFPVSQYLANFEEIPSISETFPVQEEAQIPDEILQDSTRVSWYTKAWQRFRRSANTWNPLTEKGEKPTATILLRAIGSYWLKYQHAIQMSSTLHDAGDLYFIFLKAVQKLFNLPPEQDMARIKEELLNDIKQLADNLRSAHRSHLMHIYRGFEHDLRQSFYPWRKLQLLNYPKLRRQLEKFHSDNDNTLKNYSRALEYGLEDFHIRLQFFQIQREAIILLDGEMRFFKRQYERLTKQLENAIADIQSVIPEDPKEWQDLNKFKFAFKMESAESTFYSTVERLKMILQQITSNQRTNNMVDLLLGRYDKVAQTLPEYAHIVHLDKLWSWSNKKVEIDENVPLRYTVEQYFFTQLYDSLTEIHQRWLNSLHGWMGQIDQQEQFFRFSFYSLRQEWTDPVNGWQNADRAIVHKALKDASMPTIQQLDTTINELETMYQRFKNSVYKEVENTVDGLETLIFDPGLRSKLLRLASEGSRMAMYANFFISGGQGSGSTELPMLKALERWETSLNKQVQALKQRFRFADPPKMFPIPAYYSRVFVIEPLEVPSLFVGRKKELHRLNEIANYQSHGERAVVALVGLPGMGKRSLIGHFVRNHLQRSTIHINLSLVEEDIVAIINNRIFTLDRMLRKVQLDRFDVVVMDGLESCFVETAGGAGLLQQFFSWLQRVTTKVFWIISINELSWHTIEHLDEAGGTFTHVIHLEPLEGEHLTDMLYKRHNVVGLPLQYQIPNERKYKLFNRVRPRECEKFLKWHFLDKMEKLCNGNPAVALQLWLEQASLLETNAIQLDPFIEDDDQLVLNEEELLLLRIILAQGPVGPHHLQTVVVSSGYLRVCLDKLRVLNLIEIRKTENRTIFMVNAQKYRIIYKLLREAMLLP